MDIKLKLMDNNGTLVHEFTSLSVPIASQYITYGPESDRRIFRVCNVIHKRASAPGQGGSIILIGYEMAEYQINSSFPQIGEKLNLV